MINFSTVSFRLKKYFVNKCFYTYHLSHALDTTNYIFDSFIAHRHIDLRFLPTHSTHTDEYFRIHIIIFFFFFFSFFISVFKYDPFAQHHN